MNREHLVEHCRKWGASLENARENKDSKNASAANAAATQPRWLRNVNDYVRQQPHEYQVMRFG
jgi:hypothetical protein